MVEMTWNVNQPGRWRRPEVVPTLREQDTDWKRYLMNRPFEPFDARKYLEFRLFWPYSSGHPRPVAGPPDRHGPLVHRPAAPAQRRRQRRHLPVEGRPAQLGHDDGGLRLRPARTIRPRASRSIYSSRMTNSAGDVKELYYSNGGTLDLDKNKVTPGGGLRRARGRRDGHEGEPAARAVAGRQGRGAVGDGGRHRRRHCDDARTCATGWSACAAARRRTPTSRRATATRSRSA